METSEAARWEIQQDLDHRGRRVRHQPAPQDHEVVPAGIDRATRSPCCSVLNSSSARSDSQVIRTERPDWTTRDCAAWLRTMRVLKAGGADDAGAVPVFTRGMRTGGQGSHHGAPLARRAMRVMAASVNFQRPIRSGDLPHPGLRRQSGWLTSRPQSAGLDPGTGGNMTGLNTAAPGALQAAAGAAPAAQLDGVRISFPASGPRGAEFIAVEGASLTVADGEFVAIVAPRAVASPPCSMPPPACSCRASGPFPSSARP